MAGNTLGNLQFTQAAPDALAAPNSPYYMLFWSDGSTATLSPGTPSTIANKLYVMDYLRNLSPYTGVQQPTAFAYVSNPSAAVNSTTPNNIVDTRPVAAGSVTSNQTLTASVRAFISGTSGTKSLLVGVDADLSNALTQVFTAAQTGFVTFTFDILFDASSPHTTISRVDYNSQYGVGTKRGSAAVNLSSAFNLVTEAWVANAADSITIDSVSWHLSGKGL